MDPVSTERLFGFRHAFDSPVTLWITIAVVAVLVIAAIMVRVLHALHRTDEKLHDELVKRVNSWAVMTPFLLAPVLLGAAWTILAVAILSVLCYREFARATGFFRYRSLSIVVMLGILATTFAIADHWYGFFVAIPPLTIVLLAMVAILRDEPRGYIQRVGLGVIGFLLFGHCLGHLSYMTNDADFRPIIMLIILTVELNDVFAYITGKLFGRRKIAPHTSPNKTLGGALGALSFNNSVSRDDWPFCFSRIRHRHDGEIDRARTDRQRCRANSATSCSHRSNAISASKTWAQPFPATAVFSIASTACCWFRRRCFTTSHISAASVSISPRGFFPSEANDGCVAF